MIKIIEAELDCPDHANALVWLTNEYALDPMGGGKALSDYVLANLAKELKKREGTHVILALVDDDPARLAVCLEGFYICLQAAAEHP